MLDDTGLATEPAPRRRWWRFFTQFHIKTLFFIVLLANAFFAGRATQRAVVDRAVRKSSDAAHLFARMQNFRETLKPLQLPPGIKTLGAKPASQIRLMTGAHSPDCGPHVLRDFYCLDLSGADSSNIDKHPPYNRIVTVVDALRRELYDQLPDKPQSMESARLLPFGSLSAVATITLPYGFIEITGFHPADGAKKGIYDTTKMEIRILTYLRVDDKGDW